MSSLQWCAKIAVDTANCLAPHRWIYLELVNPLIPSSVHPLLWQLQHQDFPPLDHFMWQVRRHGGKTVNTPVIHGEVREKDSSKTEKSTEKQVKLDDTAIGLIRADFLPWNICCTASHGYSPTNLPLRHGLV
jgi:hypothetical protein